MHRSKRHSVQTETEWCNFCRLSGYRVAFAGSPEYALPFRFWKYCSPPFRIDCNLCAKPVDLCAETIPLCDFSGSDLIQCGLIFVGMCLFHSMLQWLPGMFGYCKLYHPRIPEEHAARKVHLPSNHLKHSDFHECVPVVKAAEQQLESVLLQHQYLDNLSSPEKRRPFRQSHLYHLSHW